MVLQKLRCANLWRVLILNWKKSDAVNRILNIFPEKIKGTNFYGGDNGLLLTSELAK